MTSQDVPSAEEIILYSKDPATKIATITLNRPGRLNAPTVDARLRYAEMIHRANIDEDVKVLVIRAPGATWVAESICPTSWRAAARMPRTTSYCTSSSLTAPTLSTRRVDHCATRDHRSVVRQSGIGLPHPSGL